MPVNTQKPKTPLQNIYAIFDRIADRYKMMHTADNDQDAVRNFRISINQPGSLLAESSADFSLCRLGDFDPDDGLLNSLQKPELIIQAAELIQPQNQPQS